jgi:ubiquinone/menaquinone biosynthesis C-methylase UbiE
MINLDNQTAYKQKFCNHVVSNGIENAAKLHVGNIENYDKIGCIEAEIIKHYVLKRKDMVPKPMLVDVGCGSGRLARYLSDIENLGYLGTDVVDDLVKYSKSLIKRPDWRFESINGFEIPLEDETADIVCFFSVFTHLLHEQSFVYLREAKRVLSPNGIIVFSFLDFSEPGHQIVFRRLVNTHNERKVLSIFLSHSAIEFWKRELELELIEFLPGSKPMLNIDKPLQLKDGKVLSGRVSLGQSLCLMKKP